MAVVRFSVAVIRKLLPVDLHKTDFPLTPLRHHSLFATRHTKSCMIIALLCRNVACQKT